MESLIGLDFFQSLLQVMPHDLHDWNVFHPCFFFRNLLFRKLLAILCIIQVISIYSFTCSTRFFPLFGAILPFLSAQQHPPPFLFGTSLAFRHNNVLLLCFSVQQNSPRCLFDMTPSAFLFRHDNTLPQFDDTHLCLPPPISALSTTPPSLEPRWF